VGKGTVRKFNELKTLDQTTPSDDEVWAAVRHLDIEIDETPLTHNAIIVLAAVLLIICVTILVPAQSEGNTSLLQLLT
jgi:hypothetical protein